MQVVCAGCGAEYELEAEYAGKKVRCRTCQAVIEVPALGPPPEAGAWGAPADPAAEPDPYRSPAAAGGSQYPGPYPYQVNRAVAMESHRKLIGIFSIIVGVLSLLWAGFAGVIVVAGTVALQDMPARHRDESLLMVFAFYGAAFVLSGVTGILQLTAGVKVLRGSRGARTWGVASGVAGCASLWGLCIYPFCLALGIYTLVVVLAPDAKDLLEVRRRDRVARGQW